MTINAITGTSSSQERISIDGNDDDFDDTIDIDRSLTRDENEGVDGDVIIYDHSTDESERVQISVDGHVSIDDAIDSIGYGKFQHKI
eukprot:CAMPEP_0172488112 /NCGR_PEP_ID=MMETSP1066-20121228/17493_1 /TAXON_ID=671091 /ORGANISM="Coscinodiscus wailesii, Strain CCMP2513" /LENGTH=86 /DNA_ID=CAMNT_0013255127 /DNA_START=8 /DNA_END=266 /DNA_ORIENTATION=+